MSLLAALLLAVPLAVSYPATALARRWWWRHDMTRRRRLLRRWLDASG